MKKIILIIFANILGLVLLLFFVEGLLSWYRLGVTFQQQRKVAEEKHTEFDPLLGWINQKSVEIENMYGWGRSLTILPNRTRQTATGKNYQNKTAICLGDSFTFGYGVDDEAGWCSLLANDFDVINMGQGGYGFDQSMLWYWRDAAQFSHDLVLSAYILEDFNRMRSTTFIEYPKPYLQVADGKLKVATYPLKPSKPWSRTMNIFRNALSESGFEIYRVIQELKREAEQTQIIDEKEQARFEQIFELTVAALSHKIAANGSEHVFVLLPTLYDHQHFESYLFYKDWLLGLSQKYDFALIEFSDEIAAINYQTFESYFILPGEIPYSGSAWHYNEAGNRFFAELLLEKLEGIY